VLANVQRKWLFFGRHLGEQKTMWDCQDKQLEMGYINLEIKVFGECWQTLSNQQLPRSSVNTWKIRLGKSSASEYNTTCGVTTTTNAVPTYSKGTNEFSTRSRHRVEDPLWGSGRVPVRDRTCVRRRFAI
jgi:hypothetical protein